MMKQEIQLIRKLVSTIQLLQELVDELEKHGHSFSANEQACKKFGVELALGVVCKIFEINVGGTDYDEQE